MSPALPRTPTMIDGEVLADASSSAKRPGMAVDAGAAGAERS
jgi:hypothetical protein